MSEFPIERIFGPLSGPKIERIGKAYLPRGAGEMGEGQELRAADPNAVVEFETSIWRLSPYSPN